MSDSGKEQYGAELDIRTPSGAKVFDTGRAPEIMDQMNQYDSGYSEQRFQWPILSSPSALPRFPSTMSPIAAAQARREQLGDVRRIQGAMLELGVIAAQWPQTDLYLGYHRNYHGDKYGPRDAYEEYLASHGAFPFQLPQLADLRTTSRETTRRLGSWVAPRSFPYSSLYFHVGVQVERFVDNYHRYAPLYHDDTLGAMRRSFDELWHGISSILGAPGPGRTGGRTIALRRTHDTSGPSFWDVISALADPHIAGRRGAVTGGRTKASRLQGDSTAPSPWDFLSAILNPGTDGRRVGATGGKTHSAFSHSFPAFTSPPDVPLLDPHFGKHFERYGRAGRWVWDGPESPYPRQRRLGQLPARGCHARRRLGAVVERG